MGVEGTSAAEVEATGAAGAAGAAFGFDTITTQNCKARRQVEVCRPDGKISSYILLLEVGLRDRLLICKDLACADGSSELTTPTAVRPAELTGKDDLLRLDGKSLLRRDLLLQVTNLCRLTRRMSQRARDGFKRVGEERTVSVDSASI